MVQANLEFHSMALDKVDGAAPRRVQFPVCWSDLIFRNMTEITKGNSFIHTLIAYVFRMAGEHSGYNLLKSTGKHAYACTSFCPALHTEAETRVLHQDCRYPKIVG